MLRLWIFSLWISVVVASTPESNAHETLESLTDQYKIGADYRPQDGVPKGKTANCKIASTAYGGREIDYQLYAPSHYDGTMEACVMVFQDGKNWVRETGAWHLPLVFNNLIPSGETPITIGIFIDPSSQRTGTKEYDSMSDRYACYLSEEVLPEVGKSYKLTSDPNRLGIAGFSLGAICAFTVAWEKLDQFRECGRSRR
jgi:enterochelin esterase family protein